MSVRIGDKHYSITKTKIPITITVTGIYILAMHYITCSKQLQRQRRKLLYILPSGCYRYPGSPSFLREQELRMNQRTERLSAYGPLYPSCRKKQRHCILVRLCKLLLINAIIAMGKLLVNK